MRTLKLDESHWLEKNAEPFKINDRLFPAELHDAQQAITQSLLIRNHVLAETKNNNDTDLAFKRCVLLQGAPGCGKLSLIESSLQQKGYRAEDYLTVTAGEENFKKIVDQAWDQGAILIIKKFNYLAPEDERYLGQRLTEINKQNPGFLVLAQQNFSTEQGCAPISPALCNRSQIISIPAFAPKSWQALAQHLR